MRRWISSTPSAVAARTRPTGPSPSTGPCSTSSSTSPAGRRTTTSRTRGGSACSDPRALEQLKAVAEEIKPGSARKLDRAPTLVAACARQTGDPVQDREDLLASAVAAYIVLLAAPARGLGGYWRTVAALDLPAGRAALAIPPDETPLGLLHLGYPIHPQEPPERASVADVGAISRLAPDLT